MSNSTVSEKVAALVAAIVSDLKLDLYDLEFNGGILKITVDTPAGSEGGVTLDQLSLITRLVGRDFDHHDPIPGRYTLEVTSPGLERTLRTPAQFRREIGKSVQIRLRATVNGERRVQGVLIAADETTATILLESGRLESGPSERVIAIDMIDRAKTVFQWDKGEKISQKPRSSANVAGPGRMPQTKAGERKVARNSPKKDSRKSKVAAGGVKRSPGPSDELDPPIEEEATA